jgi:lycopene cyclase CruA
MTSPEDKFDLTGIRRRFPLACQYFSRLPDYELQLRRIWEIEQRFQRQLDNGFLREEVLFEGTRRNCSIAGEFDVIYAGGGLGLIHAAVMAKRFGRSVLIFDSHKVGKTHRDWNISDAELNDLVRAGLFENHEIETAVVNRYRTGFVKFYDANSSIKAPPLEMGNVLNVAIDAEGLLGLALIKAREAGAAVINNTRFLRAFVEKERVIVETENIDSGAIKTYSSRLFVDATGTASPLSRQLNYGKSITHVCPTVGTVARGFSKGTETQAVNFSVGEILVSTEDAANHRQLMWEGFAGSEARDEYTTYLFFYDSLDSKAEKSLLRLFEDYFEKLSDYKHREANWQIVKPVYGYIPSIHHHGWDSRKRTASDRVLLSGDAAGLSSPLTFCGFGSHVRNLCRLTEETEKALQANDLSEKSLAGINAYEPRVAQMASLAEFMRPAETGNASDVNETMNAVMTALHQLDPEISREMFQDRISFASFRKVLIKTAIVHPAVFRKMISHLGATGSFWWMANIAEAAIKETKTRREK